MQADNCNTCDYFHKVKVIVTACLLACLLATRLSFTTSFMSIDSIQISHLVYPLYTCSQFFFCRQLYLTWLFCNFILQFSKHLLYNLQRKRFLSNYQHDSVNPKENHSRKCQCKEFIHSQRLCPYRSQ